MDDQPLTPTWQQLCVKPQIHYLDNVRAIYCKYGIDSLEDSRWTVTSMAGDEVDKGT